MTYQEAAEFAGCSISTLKRYRCGACDQTALRQLINGCGAIYEKCDPKKDKTWPPRVQKIRGITGVTVGVKFIQ